MCLLLRCVFCCCRHGEVKFSKFSYSVWRQVSVTSLRREKMSSPSRWFYVETRPTVRPSRKLLILLALNSLFSLHPLFLASSPKYSQFSTFSPFCPTSLSSPRLRRRTAVLSSNHVLDSMRCEWESPGTSAKQAFRASFAWKSLSISTSCYRQSLTVLRGRALRFPCGVDFWPSVRCVVCRLSGLVSRRLTHMYCG